MTVSAYEVLREVEERMRNERFCPPDWKGSDMAILVKVLVDHINRAMGEQRDRTVLGIP